MGDSRKSNSGGCSGLIFIAIAIGGVFFWEHLKPEAPTNQQVTSSPTSVSLPASPATAPAPETSPPPTPIQPQPDTASLNTFVHPVHDNYGMITLADGTSLVNVMVTKVDPAGVTLFYDGGGGTIPFEKFRNNGVPPDIRKIYGFDPVLADAYRKTETELTSANAAQIADAAKVSAQAQADAERLVKEKEAFIAGLEQVGFDSSIVKSVSVRNNWVTIVVSNVFHVMSYQTRLQTAQDFEKIWSAVHTETNDDPAAVRITDYNGNEVGGSGLMGIWVKNR